MKHKASQTKLAIKAELAELKTVRQFVRRFLTDLPKGLISEDRVDLIELAANEVVANIIRHAYDESNEENIFIEANLADNRIDFKFYDWGKAWNPNDAPPPEFDGSKEGGFGLYIISQAVDNVSYLRDQDGKNCAHLTVITKEET